jgi:N,N'-diacetyllegionaminate synthase
MAVVGQQMSILIIAEAGVNHNGDLATALRLIEAAAAAGADIVKFQTFNADRLVTRSAAKAAYQRRSDALETQHQMLSRLALDPDEHEQLLGHCRTHDIGFLSTPFDVESIDLLVRLGVDRLKIPSGEITNLPYLRRIGSLRRPVILSSGMATLEEVSAALAVLESAGTQRSAITVLHCTTQYPTPAENVNLRAMMSMSRQLNVAVGYSDHTRGIEVPIAAVALGATIIEKHLTLDRRMSGPDHEASLEPQEFARMIQAIRAVEVAMGDGIKRPVAAELEIMDSVRKSVVAARSIRKGEEFTPANMTVKRPGTGISPMKLDEIVGRIAHRDFAEDEPIELC